MRTRVGVVLASATALAVAISGCAKTSTGGDTADNYPEKSIKYVIPFDPGGESDITARLQQAPLEDAFGQSVVVSNHEGGGGAVGWSQLANRTRPDGYTVMGANLPHIALQPLARDDAGYQTEDIKWAYIFESTPDALVVAKDSPYRTVKQFVRAAKEKKLTVGGSSSFSSHHMATLAFADEADAKLTYVPFSGQGAAVPAVLGGQVDALMTSLPGVKGKDVRVLAVGSKDRLSYLPHVPTFTEKGYDINVGTWRGVAVPPDTPGPVVDEVAKTFREVNKDPKVMKKMRHLRFETVNMGPGEAKRFTKQRTAKARKLLKRFHLLKK